MLSLDDRSSATAETAAIRRVSPAEMADILALDSESSFAGAPIDSSSNTASLSSTPPTSVSDSISLASEPQKPEIETVIALLEQPSIVSVPGPDAERATPLVDAVRSQTPCQDPTPTPTRPRRSRASAPVYNIAKLSGTDHRARRRSKGDVVRDGPRGTVLASQAAVDAVFVAPEPAEKSEIVVEHPGDTTNDGAASLDRDWSVDHLDTPKSAQRQPRREATKAVPKIATRKSTKTSSPEISRRSTRLSGPVTESLATQLANMGKRARKAFEQTHPTILRELKRLADTKEFAKVEDEPVLQTVWRNGKFYDPRVAAAEEKAKADAAKRAKAEMEKQASLDAQEDLSRKKAQMDADSADASAKPERRPKKWLEKGLYAGQDAPHDPLAGLSGADKKLLSQLPEFSEPMLPNKALPFPMFGGLRLLLSGRDFKLPFDVCHPLMDQPKPKEWRKITKSRFVGDSLSYWKKNTYYDRSVCVCTPADGCGEHCLNRSVLYECNEGNCNVGRDLCKNRAFQDLQDRTKTGGSYRVGVEVYHTGDRGFGVRANRCFEPGQIIMEYAGEIITEEECDRRMNEVYKDKQCYYLMSFDQNMILDATTGSIARFVNHSCSPNCRMIKWIVSGVPRMALFAGDRQIQTGDELTYDYNFDPFSAKNVQKCLCGSGNCRGVLGPKTRNDNAKKAAAAAAAKDSVGAKVKAGKRKIKDLLSAPDDDESETASMKKRKLQAGEGLKRSLSSASLKVSQRAAKLKRSVSSITVTTTKAAVALMTGSASASTSGTPRSGKGSIKKSVTRRASSSTLLSKVMKNKGSPRSKVKASLASSATKRNSAPALKKSETIVAATPTGGKGRAATAQTPSSRRKSGKGEIVVGVREPATGSPRSRKPSAKALAAAADEIKVASSVLRPTSGGGVKKNRKTTSPSAKTKAAASKLTRTKSVRQTLVSAFSGARKTTGSWRRKSAQSTTSEDAYAIPSTPEPEEADHEPAPMPRSPPAVGRSGIDIRARYAQVRLVPKDDDE
ncbi:hypothetical protein RB595_010649 [Gaeumannomyces hyphopodioides]